VFDTIVRSAATLCHAAVSAVFLTTARWCSHQPTTAVLRKLWTQSVRDSPALGYGELRWRSDSD
jgi:hypothetical protein